jgi:hypothetical protein
VEQEQARFRLAAIFAVEGSHNSGSSDAAVTELSALFAAAHPVTENVAARHGEE